MSCININDKEVIRLMQNGRFNESTLNTLLNSMVKRGVKLSSGVKLEEGFTNLQDVKVKDLKNEQAYLRSIKSENVSSIAEAIDKVKDRMNKRLKDLNNDLNRRVLDRDTEEKKKEYKEIETRRDLLDAEIKHLEENLNATEMLSISSKQLDRVEKLLQSDNLNLDQLQDIANTLQIFNNFHINYIPVTDRTEKRVFLDEEGEIESEGEFDTEIYKEAKNLTIRTSELYKTFKELDKDNHFIRLQNIIDPNITKENFYEAVKDVDSYKMYTSILGDATGSKFYQAVSVFVKTINNKAKTLQKKYEQKFDTAFAELQNSPLFKTHGYDLMFEKDEQGNVIGTAFKYKKEFFEAKLLNDKRMKQANKTAEDYQKDRDFKKENYNTFCLIDAVLSENKEAELAKGKAEIIAIYGETLGESIYNTTLSKANRFVEAYTTVKANYNEADLNQWLMENDPRPEIKALKEGTNFYQPRNYYGMYKHSIPKAQWYSDNYMKMTQDEAYYNFYNRFISLMEDYFHAMPYSVVSSKGINKNFLPFVMNAHTEMLKKQNGFGSFVERGARKAFSWFSTSKTSDLIYQEYNSETGAVANLSVPIHYIIPATKVMPNGDIVTDNDVREFDLMKIVKEVLPQISKYQYQMQAVPVLEQSIRIAADMVELKGTNAKGEQETVNNGLSRLNEMLRNEINSVLGDRKNKPELNTKWELMTKEQKEEIEALENRKQAEIAEIQAKEIAPEEKEELIKKTEDFYNFQKDKRTRYFSGGQTFRSLMKFYVLKTLGFSTSFVTEAFNSVANVLIDGNGNPNYGLSDYFNAILNTGKPKDKNLKKLFGVSATTEYGENKSGFEHVALWFAEGQDNIQKGSVLIAMLKREKLITLSGEMISLYDAFDEQGNWKSELFDEETNQNWNPDYQLNTLEERNSFYRFKDKFDAQTDRLFGPYRNDAYLLGKRSTLGQALFMFKTWLPKAIAVRFEDKRHDIFLDREVKGRWKSLVDVYSENGFTKGLVATFTGRTQGLTLIDADLDAENMRRNMVELYTIISTMVASIGLVMAFADEEDDDEDEMLALYTFLNIAGRLQQDLLYFANPAEANKLVQNAIPVLKLYSDFEDLCGAFYKTLEGKPTYENGLFKDWLRIVKESAEFMPPTNGALKWYKFINEDITTGK